MQDSRPRPLTKVELRPLPKSPTFSDGLSCTNGQHPQYSLACDTLTVNLSLETFLAWNSSPMPLWVFSSFLRLSLRFDFLDSFFRLGRWPASCSLALFDPMVYLSARVLRRGFRA
jgi:hypothetical protein